MAVGVAAEAGSVTVGLVLAVLGAILIVKRRRVVRWIANEWALGFFVPFSLKGFRSPDQDWTKEKFREQQDAFSEKQAFIYWIAIVSFILAISGILLASALYQLSR